MKDRGFYWLNGIVVGCLLLVVVFTRLLEPLDPWPLLLIGRWTLKHQAIGNRILFWLAGWFNWLVEGCGLFVVGFSVVVFLQASGFWLLAFDSWLLLFIGYLVFHWTLDVGRSMLDVQSFPTWLLAPGSWLLLFIGYLVFHWTLDVGRSMLDVQSFPTWLLAPGSWLLFFIERWALDVERSVFALALFPFTRPLGPSTP